MNVAEPHPFLLVLGLVMLAIGLYNFYSASRALRGNPEHTLVEGRREIHFFSWIYGAVFTFGGLGGIAAYFGAW